ncbi:MAG: hypothetical protein KC996_03880 [Phycisphaerales bacterium]|nr:hypothetical protein [Phycisphaerales bacterium]
MGQFLQTIAPFIVPILIVVVSVGARFAKWTKEKQEERQQLQRRERARAEALRTGRPVEDPGTVDLSAREMAANTKAAGQARLEALRQQRIEQLRRIREQRSAPAQSSTQAPARQSPQRATPSRPIARPVAQQAQPDPRRAALAAAQRRKEHAEQMALQERRKQLEIARRRAELAQIAEQTKANALRSKPAEGQSRLSSLRVNPELNVHVGTLHADHADQPIASSFQTLTAGSSHKQMRSVMGNRSAIRHAIIVNELLQKPIAFRTESPDF